MEMFFGLESRLGGGFLGRSGPCGVFGCEAKLFWGLQKLTTKFSGDVFFLFFLCGIGFTSKSISRQSGLTPGASFEEASTRDSYESCGVS